MQACYDREFSIAQNWALTSHWGPVIKNQTSHSVHGSAMSVSALVCVHPSVSVLLGRGPLASGPVTKSESVRSIVRQLAILAFIIPDYIGSFLKQGLEEDKTGSLERKCVVLMVTMVRYFNI